MRQIQKQFGDLANKCKDTEPETGYGAVPETDRRASRAGAEAEGVAVRTSDQICPVNGFQLVL